VLAVNTCRSIYYLSSALGLIKSTQQRSTNFDMTNSNFEDPGWLELIADLADFAMVAPSLIMFDSQQFSMAYFYTEILLSIPSINYQARCYRTNIISVNQTPTKCYLTFWLHKDFPFWISGSTFSLQLLVNHSATYINMLQNVHATTNKKFL
jgi:hypothetical protein